MTTLEAMMAAIPEGAENAISQREIWRRSGSIGAESTLWIYLFEALASGGLKRRKHLIPTGFMWLYWREPT